MKKIHIAAPCLIILLEGGAFENIGIWQSQ